MRMKHDPTYSQDELDNHANQLNPNNDAYWQSRGFDGKLDDWDDDLDCSYDGDDMDWDWYAGNPCDKD